MPLSTSKLSASRSLNLFILTGFLFIPFVMSAHAQSFNCRYAKKADEKVICENSRLSRLDVRMVSLFDQVMQEAPKPLKRMTRAQQDAWLRSRHRCTWNVRCIAIHYRARIRELGSHLEGRSDERDRVRLDPREQNYAPQDYIPGELR